MHQTIKPVAGALVLSMILVACGGGGSDDSSTPAVSSSAAASSKASSAAASSVAASSAAASSAAASSAAASSAAASSAAASSAAASSAAASSAAASSAAASSAAAAVVLHANFQSLGSTGLTENVETTVSAVNAPTVINTKSYSVQLDGKLKINTTQTLPPTGSDASWSVGVVQFGNNTTSTGKVIVNNVTCPFKLTVNHSPSNSTDTARKLVVTFNGAQVYNDGGGVVGATGTPGYTAVLDSRTTSTTCLSGTTTIEAYGYNGTNGAGVRIYDLKIEQ